MKIQGIVAFGAWMIAGPALADTYREQAQVIGDGSSIPPYTITNAINTTATKSTAPNNGVNDISASAGAFTQSLKASATFSGTGLSTQGYGNGFAEAMSTVILNPNMSGATNLNVLLDTHMAIGDTATLASRAAAVNLSDYNDIPDNGLGYLAFAIDSKTMLIANLRDLTIGNSVQMSVQAQVMEAVRVRNSGGIISAYQEQSAATGRVSCGPGACTSHPLFSGSPMPGNTQTPPPVMQPVTSADIANQNYSFAANFIVGHSYQLTLDLQCQVDVTNKYSTMDGITSSCDAGHSAYWNGITNGPSGFSLMGDDGQNYVYSAASSPVPLAEQPGSSVPEPASWAMMVGGFGLLGTALRRRRSPVAHA